MTVLSIGNKPKQNRFYTEPYWNHDPRFPSEGASESYCPYWLEWRSSAPFPVCHQLLRSSSARTTKGKVQAIVGSKKALHLGFIVLQLSKVKKDVSKVIGGKKRENKNNSVYSNLISSLCRSIYSTSSSLMANGFWWVPLVDKIIFYFENTLFLCVTIVVLHHTLKTNKPFLVCLIQKC